MRTYTVIDQPQAAGGPERARMTGAIFAPRRQPTPDEIRRINDSLAAMERGMDAPSAPAATSNGKPASSSND